MTLGNKPVIYKKNLTSSYKYQIQNKVLQKNCKNLKNNSIRLNLYLYYYYRFDKKKTRPD